jgi:hypothetical protein
MKPMPKLYNYYTDLVPVNTTKRIDRTTKWGNPFVVGRDGTIDEVLKKYSIWITDQVYWNGLDPEKLRGLDLACWCDPSNCHGSILIMLANK